MGEDDCVFEHQAVSGDKVSYLRTVRNQVSGHASLSFSLFIWILSGRGGFQGIALKSPASAHRFWQASTSLNQKEGNSEHPLLTINAGAMQHRHCPQFVPKFVGTKKKDLHRIDASPYLI
jgi:hypothetical protein